MSVLKETVQFSFESKSVVAFSKRYFDPSQNCLARRMFFTGKQDKSNVSWKTSVLSNLFLALQFIRLYHSFVCWLNHRNSQSFSHRIQQWAIKKINGFLHSVDLISVSETQQQQKWIHQTPIEIWIRRDLNDTKTAKSPTICR